MMSTRAEESTIGGKVSILATFVGVAILAIGVFGELPHGPVAFANTASTSVTVLNTPPQWDVTMYAQEAPASASSSPTNAGSNVTWIASSTDSSNDNYYLLICTNFASPTPNNGAAPSCNGGGGNQIAISASTISGTQATAVRTTTSGDAEINYWFSYLCDGNATGAACNPLAWNGFGNGSSTPNGSPYLVNHRPTFSVFTNNAPQNPGATITWNTTASDADTYGGTNSDTVRLFVCKLADFTGTSCGVGGTWASSTYVASNPTVNYVLPNPSLRGTSSAFGYVIDNHGFFGALVGGTGSQQASNTPVVVNNMAPSISSSSISLLNATDTNSLILTTLGGETPNMRALFTVSDQNSCVTLASTSEIVSTRIDLHRSGVASTSCAIDGDYNPNSCYPGTLPLSTWNVSCTASTTSCFGDGDSDVVWNCTFPMWYLSDATDVGSQFAAQNWIITAQAADGAGASSTRVDGATGTELFQFLGYDLSTTTIAYGGLQPGNSADLTSGTGVGLLAIGNVGLDETLYGTDMCPTYPTCTGNATSTIFVNNQKYASSTMAYSAATSTLAYNPGALFALHVPKTISRAATSTRTTYWGILVPGAITLSGNYVGTNTIIGATSPSSAW